MPGKKHVYTEPEKIRHTTHWDLDYLPRDAVDHYYSKRPVKGDDHTVSSREKDHRRQRCLGLSLILGGVGLLTIMVLLGRFLNGQG